jgi:hypothetical protein
MSSGEHIKSERPSRSVNESSIKVTTTFRIPLDINYWIKEESAARQWSANEFVVTLLDDYLGWFGFPSPDAAAMEADRKALGVDRRQYLKWVLAKRVEQVREKGPGFDNWVDPGTRKPDKK